MSVLWSILAGIGTVLLFLLKGVGILLLVVLVLGLLLMFCPFCADVQWAEGIFQVKAGALGITFPVFRYPAPEKPKKEKKKKSKKKPEAESKSKPEATPRKKAKLTLNIVCTILRGAGKLTKAVEDIAYLNVAVAGIVSGVSKGFGQTALGHETYELVRTHFTQEAKPYLHGEIVAIGDCLQLAFNGHPEQVAPFRAFMRSMNMPLTLEDIGIDPNSPKMENLFQDLFHSPFMEPTAENEARLRKAMHYLSAD